MHRDCESRHFRRAMWFMGRHRARHAWRRFAGGFDGGFGGGFGGRKLSARDLELVILALLAEQPLHGYRIIKELEERSHGFYVPSPGMIYPALAYLEEVGRVTSEAEGVKKLYRLTDEGRAFLEANRNEANAILGQMAVIGRKMEQLREFFADDDSDDLREVIHLLRATVRDKRFADAAERKRVADVLKRAIAEIRGN